jgi:hypothetical protein
VLADETSRQSFLGPESEQLLWGTTVAIVGASGGGAPIVQECAHVGIGRYRIFDPQASAPTDLNRLVGAGEEDVEHGLDKVDIARRTVLRVRPHAEVRTFKDRWQDHPDEVAASDIVFGGVDGFGERAQLEAFARRARVPYVDIGLDVYAGWGQPPRMVGQIIVSVPGHPCMRCLGFLTDEKLALEGRRYGGAGPRAQVVWANGVLASTAVGIAVQMLTDWARRPPCLYLSYDANLGTVSPHPRLDYIVSGPCPHYPVDAVGPPRFRTL